MKKSTVLSVNIGQKKILTFNKKTIETGIFKYTVNSNIHLKKQGVKNDNVIDKKHHGGSEKAVYAFCKNHYGYFQKLYPNLDFRNGMFGENLTVSNLFETEVYIGDVFKIGNAIIQVSQPRYPCYKLGLVFNNQKIVKQFLNTTFTGFYFRVMQEGTISKGDEIQLIKKAENSMTLAEVFSLYTTNKNNLSMIKNALKLDFLSDEAKVRFKKQIQN